MATIPQRVPLVDLKTGLITREWVGPITQALTGSDSAQSATDLSAVNARIDALEAAILAQSMLIAELQLGYQA